MKLYCPNCDAKVPVDQINIQKLVAACPICNYLFNFEVKPKAEKIIVPKPDWATVNETEKELQISWPWHKEPGETQPNLILLIGLTGIILCIIFFGYRAHLIEFGLVGLLMGVALLGPLIFIPLYFIWSALTIWLNSTVLTADHNSIRLTHGPIPASLFSTHSYSRRSIQRLYTRKVIDESTSAMRSDEITYYLKAVIQNGEELDLIGEASQPDLPSFVKSALHTFWDIDEDIHTPPHPIDEVVRVKPANSGGMFTAY